MFIGHLAAGMAAKKIEPKLSLGTTVLAAMLVDLLAFVFLLAGIEHFDPVPGAASNRAIGHDIAFSHSLLMSAIWGALFAGVWFLRKRHPRGAWLLFAAVLSHWLLDVLSHRPDMPLMPGVHKVFGFGLWNSLPATLLVEGGAWLPAIVMYVRATRPKNRTGILAFWIGTALLTWMWYKNITAGIDPNPVKAGMGGLIVFSLVVAWAYWINRLRLLRAPGRP
jgi:membrane-bound metal-dependent hydrolase YbcI (DUF457 family)